MKVVLLLVGGLCAIHCAYARGGNYYSGGGGGGGGSWNDNLAGPPMPYDFSYVADVDGGTSSRQERGDGSGRVWGSYTINDPDGRIRRVQYQADQGGFRADVQTNEAGVEDKDPADVNINLLPGHPVGYTSWSSRPSGQRPKPYRRSNQYGGGGGGGGIARSSAHGKRYVLVPVEALSRLGGNWNNYS